MTWNAKAAGMNGGSQQNGVAIDGISTFNDTTSAAELQTLETRLAELDSLMALDNENWIDYYDEWLELWPLAFALRMGAGL